MRFLSGGLFNNRSAFFDGGGGGNWCFRLGCWGGRLFNGRRSLRLSLGYSSGSRSLLNHNKLFGRGYAFLDGLGGLLNNRRKRLLGESF